MLPRTMAAMRGRAPEAIASLAEALGTTPGRIVSRLQSLGGGRRRLRDLGADRERLEPAVNAILERPDLANTPEPPDRDELEALLAASLVAHAGSGRRAAAQARLPASNAAYARVYASAWTRTRGRSAPPRTDEVISEERFQRYHAYARRHGVNWPLYLLARLILSPHS